LEGEVFVVARNPDPWSCLLSLLRLPVEGGRQLVLATRGLWPAGKDLFCYELGTWPEGAEVVATVPVVRCWQSGSAVHLVLRRRQRRRSLFVWTQRRGRVLIFWRSRTSMQGARPSIRVPQARGLERRIQIAVDVHESYPWRFARYGVPCQRRELPAGDYAVLDGDRCVAVVERKTADDLAKSATAGDLALNLAELGRLPHAVLVVEGRLSDVIKVGQRGEVQPGWLLNLVAALQVAHPQVAWVFAETRSLAEDYAYRWLSACARAEGLGDNLPVGGTPARSAASRGPEVLDAVGRRELALREAASGTVWTTARFAARCGVGTATAWKDLKALVAEGRLVAEGAGRSRRYRWAAAAQVTGEPC